MGPGQAHLAWDAPPDPDVDHYRVYKSITPDFVPSPSRLVGQSTVAAWDDSAFTPDTSYYRVSAVDHGGNESATVLGGPGHVLGANGPLAPRVSYLARPAPNPASANARIEYGLARPGRAQLAVFDLSGRRVRTLVQGVVPAGVWRTRWDARDDAGRPRGAGVYFVRLTAPGIDRTQKLVLAP